MLVWIESEVSNASLDDTFEQARQNVSSLRDKGVTDITLGVFIYTDDNSRQKLKKVFDSIPDDDDEEYTESKMKEILSGMTVSELKGLKEMIREVEDGN